MRSLLASKITCFPRLIRGAASGRDAILDALGSFCKTEESCAAAAH